MPNQPFQVEILELTERFRQFHGVPKGQKKYFLAFVAPKRCKRKRANALFDKISLGEATKKEEHQFFVHAYMKCDLCKIAFLQLVWLTTEPT